MRIKIMVMVVLLVAVLFSGCSQASADIGAEDSWDEVAIAGMDSEVTIAMWGGNDLVNSYMDDFVAPQLKEMYGITLNRVPMNAPDFVAKIFNEKKNSIDDGTIDILWINAENFKTLKDVDALYGPFTDILPNLATYYSSDLAVQEYDSGIAVDGMEAIWGSAQLVYTYDSGRIDAPPRSYAEILQYAMDNPGTVTYPNPLEDFVGSGFVRNAYFELTDFDSTKDYTEEEFLELSAPVIDYFKELHPHLWNEGTAFPATVALQNQMLLNSEVAFSMGFEVFQTSGLIAQGEYPDSFETYVLETGTIGNSHYLAIPFNSQNKNGALLAIDFLQSPEAQIEKMKPTVWGDMSSVNTSSLSQEQLDLLADIENSPAIIPISELHEYRIEDMNAEYIGWIENIWSENIIK